MRHRVGVGCYVLSVLVGIVFVTRLVGALIRWEFAPGWFWVVGLVAFGVLQGLAGVLMEKGR